MWANDQVKSSCLDFEISLPPMVLKILYGVRDNRFALLWEFGGECSQNLTTTRQKKLVFIILTCADLVQPKNYRPTLSLYLSSRKVTEISIFASHFPGSW